jgi:enterochelin esterase family protein
MKKDAAGIWSVSVGPLEPETYDYTFVVDGVRTIDPAPHAAVAAGAVSSTTFNRFVIRGESPAIDELLPVPHGVVRQHLYRSKALDVVRRVVVYTPPDHDSSTKRRYPVLYLLHGARNGETFWTDFARVNLVADNLIASGAAKPLVIVMPNGNIPGGRSESHETLLGRELIQDVIPWVESAFHVKTGARHRGIAGFSLGGRQAFAIALTHLGRFSHLATFSAALADTQPSATFAALPAETATVNAKLPFLWMACGTEDGLFAANEQASVTLRERGITHTFHKTSGGHSWKLALRWLQELLPRMFVER